MAKESIAPPDLHGRNHIRKPIHVLASGRTVALMLTTVLFGLLSTHHLVTFYHSPIQTHIPPQETKTGHEDKACNLFNGTWIRDFRGPVYNNITCPTMPESRNCGKYGKQMDYVNWKWAPHGCDMVRFEPQLFLNIVQGKTLAFAADSIGRNQMESLLCLLSQLGAHRAHELAPKVDVKTGSPSDTKDRGTPCRRTMSVKNARATDSAEYGCANGMKWRYLPRFVHHGEYNRFATDTRKGLHEMSIHLEAPEVEVGDPPGAGVRTCSGDRRRTGHPKHIPPPPKRTFSPTTQQFPYISNTKEVETPTKVYSDGKDKFVTWYFRSHNFTLKALWTKFLVEASEREVNGTLVEMHDIHLDKLDARLAANLQEINILVISSSRWFFRENYLYEGGKLIGCIYCSEDNITSFDVITAIQRALRTALNNLSNCRECGLQLTLVRTATPAHFENGFWNTGGYCNRTEPVGGEASTRTVEWEIRNAQVEEASRAQKESSHKGQMRIEILDITQAMSMRPDAHPGIHWNNKWMRGYSDCSHWCLPGPIDMWNELLLSVLKRY
ncbi:hypothetical protein U9M48_032856, partial [Paspalum notatum var. saurae]